MIEKCCSYINRSIDKHKHLLRIIYTLYSYTIGAVPEQLPLFLATVILLRPCCIDLSEPQTFFTFVKYLFYNDYSDYGGIIYRDDLYFTILTAFIVVMLVNLPRAINPVNIINKRISRILKCTWYAFLILTFVIRQLLLQMFDMKISSDSVRLLLETNTREASGFVKEYLFGVDGILIILYAVLITFLIVAAEKTYVIVRRKVMHGITIKIAMILLAVVLLRFGIRSISTHEFMWRANQNTVMQLITTCNNLLEDDERASNFYVIINRVAHEQKAALSDADSMYVFFVIGESAIRHHFGIYGYPLQTTPLMKKEEERGNLVIFTDVMSPFNFTTNAVKNMLSVNSIQREESWYDYPFVPQLFRKAGYNTLVIDNQRGKDKNLLCSFYQMFSPKTVEACYDSLYEDVWKYDKEMMPLIGNIIHRSEKKRTFCMVHIEGQHIPYSDRTAPEDRKFSAEDIRRKEKWIDADRKTKIADYDNAVLQTDKVLGDLFKLLKNKCAVVVFVSDHGEEVYDYRDASSRPPANRKMLRQYARNLYSTPMIVWMSDCYKETYPNVAKAVAEARQKPYCHDHIGHLLLSLAHIKSPYLRDEDNIISTNYKQTTRKLFLDGEWFDYDSLIPDKSFLDEINKRK